MAFEARYPGRCADCGGGIHAGETIRKARGRRGYAHAECEAHEPTYKERHGRCEDAPCCGCCGGWQEAASSGFIIYG